MAKIKKRWFLLAASPAFPAFSAFQFIASEVDDILHLDIWSGLVCKLAAPSAFSEYGRDMQLVAAVVATHVGGSRSDFMKVVLYWFK